MPEVNISPALAVQRHARCQGDATALVYGPERISYAEFDAQAATLAAMLAAGGVGRGERVAYLGLNSPALLTTFLACARLGAVFVPVNHRLTEHETALVLDDCTPAALVCEEGRRELTATLAAHAFVLHVGDRPGQRWLPASASGSDTSPTPQPRPLAEADLAALLYTSGSTGRPKGVMLTHGNLWWNQVNVCAMVDSRLQDTTLAVAPMFHIGGLNALTLGTLVRGGTVVVHRGFDPQQCLTDLQTHRVSGVFAVPAMFAALAALPGFAEADLSALRTAVVAGAPVPPSLIRRYAEHGVLLQQAWGLTETAPFATYLPPGAALAKLGSAGLPMPYTELRVVAPDTAADAGPHVRGELWVRGPNVTKGYWNNPRAGAEAFTQDGWFRTGDVGYLDDDGYLYVVDRVKDVIITGGENVYPSEVEHVLAELPGVSGVAVVGRPDDHWGEAVTAVLSLARNTAETPTLESVRTFAGHRLARYKLPTELAVLDRIPRNGSGKIDKPLLRRRLADWRTASPGEACVATGLAGADQLS
ncbi:AMP-binding protein [Kitasatospora sp. NPDC093102]|uniref:AMP-binding protein n=1 Tax=Kitasatospora sp. NPDC093102 TaxID=3155069 RepID=UPI00342E5CE5